MEEVEQPQKPFFHTCVLWDDVRSSKIIYRRLIMIKIANYVDQNTILVYQLVYLPSIKVASNQGEISEWKI